MNKKLLLAGVVVLVVGLAVGLSLNRQPSKSDGLGSVRGIQDTYTDGVVLGETLDNWVQLTIRPGEQADRWLNDTNKVVLVDQAIIRTRHDPNSATTSDEAIVEPSSAYRLDVGTSTTRNFAPGFGLAEDNGGYFASGTEEALPFGSIIDRLFLASSTAGLNRTLSFSRNQLYDEVNASTTVGKELGIYLTSLVAATGARVEGDTSEMVPMPVEVGTSTYAVALLYEQGGTYDSKQRYCTPGLDDIGYGCEAATSTARGFIVDIWLHYITK